jgi:hypothetical protein
VIGLRIDRHVVYLPLQIWLAADNPPHGLAAGQRVAPVVETLRISIDSDGYGI